MNQLQWLVGKEVRCVTKRDHDWVFGLGDEATVTVSCLWRYVNAGRIRLTSQDHGQQFGHPSPVDAVRELNLQLANRVINLVKLKEGTLDLTLHFGSDRILEILPDSSGYESWVAQNLDSQFIAVGGGELAIFAGPRS